MIHAHISKTRLLLTGILVVACIFLAIHLSGITAIGLEYDELLLVNGALGCPSSHIFLEFSKQIGSVCIPIMLSSYIGALHSWVYAPFLAILPHTPLTVRLIHVGIVTLATFIMTQTLWRHFSKKVAVLWLFLMTFNAQVVFTHRFERPTSVQYLLLATWFWLQYSRAFRPVVKFFIQGFIIGLMIYSKQDTLFLVAAIYGGLGSQWLRDNFIHNRNALAKDVFAHWRVLLALVSGMIIGLLPLLYYVRYAWRRVLFITTAVHTPLTLDLLLAKLERWSLQWTSADWYWYVFRQDLLLPRSITVLSALLSAALIGCALWHTLKKTSVAWIATAYLLFTLTFFLYGGLISSHHRLLILPLGLLILAHSIAQLGRIVQVVTLAAVIVVFASTWQQWNITQQTNCGALSFSCASESLAQQVSTTTIDAVYAADWGIANQLLYFGNKEIAVDEVAFRWNADMDLPPELVALADSCAAFILFTPDKDIFEHTPVKTRDYLTTRSEYSYKTVTDRFSNPTYQIWSCHD